MVNRLALFNELRYGLDNERHQFDNKRPESNLIGDIEVCEYCWSIVLYKCKVHGNAHHVVLWGNKTGEW